MEFVHRSVLLKETVDNLNIRPDGIYVDGTLGGGGHAYEVCRRLGKEGVSSELIRMEKPLEPHPRDWRSLAAGYPL